MGAPILFHWPWYWHLPALLPWLLLGLALALPRANRDRHALLILVPLLVLGLLWGGATKLTGMRSDVQVQFSLKIEFLLVGLALLWLNADRIGHCRGFARLAASLGILLLTDVVMVLSFGRTLPGPQGVGILTFSVAMILALLVPLSLTRWLARRRYRPVRFMAWLAVWCLVFTLVGAMAFWVALMLGESYDPLLLRSVLAQIVALGLVLGLCLYVIHLPYMLLMFRSPFFRQRFRVWLGVESLLPQVQAANPDDVCSGRDE